MAAVSAKIVVHAPVAPADRPVRQLVPPIARRTELDG
jgi:hypothetical protein